MNKGTKYPGAMRKSKTYGESRVCELVNCEVTLSKYNKNTLCFNHSPKTHGRVRGWIDPNNKKG
jgi:hypothetical protein